MSVFLSRAVSSLICLTIKNHVILATVFDSADYALLHLHSSMSTGERTVILRVMSLSSILGYTFLSLYRTLDILGFSETLSYCVIVS